MWVASLFVCRRAVILPRRVVYAIHKLLELLALRIGEQAGLLVAPREVDVHVRHAGHGRGWMKFDVEEGASRFGI